MHEQQQARELLVAVRLELQRLELWDPVPPSPQKLASTMPFCFDTLAFNQWLQWIYLPRTAALLDRGGRPPENSQIAPMAEWYVEQENIRGAQRLVELIAELDELW